MSENSTIYAEYRYAPHLLSTDDLSTERVVELVCEGLEEGSRQFEVTAKSILCCMRHFPDWSDEVVSLAHQFRHRGVVGIDVAGDEKHPSEPHSKVCTFSLQ